MDDDTNRTSVELEKFLPQDGKNGTKAANGKFVDSESQRLNGKDWDPFKERSVEHPTTNCDTLTHLLKASLGSGILAMPMAFKASGLVLGIIYGIIASIICTHCSYILVKCAHELYYRTRVTALSFAGVGELACKNGPAWSRPWAMTIRHTILISLFMTYFGTCSVYTVIIAENFKTVLKEYVPAVAQSDDRIFIASLMVPLVLLCYVPNLKMLAPISMVANALMGVGLVITLYYIAIELPTGKEVQNFAPFEGVAFYFCTTIFAMEAIGVVMPLENNMKTPKNFLGLGGVLNQGMAGVTLIYLLLGFLGYMAYGDDTKLITLNLPDKEIPAQIVKVFIALAVFCTYGLQWFVCLEIVWDALKDNFEKNVRLIEYVVRTLLVVASVLLAVAVPTIGPFISLIGALCFSILGLILPCVIELVTFWETGMGRGKWRLWKNGLVIVFGVGLLIVGTYMSTLDIIKEYSKEPNLASNGIASNATTILDMARSNISATTA